MSGISQKMMPGTIPAIVKMPNIQIGITSFVYKISTQSLCVYHRVFVVSEFKYAI